MDARVKFSLEMVDGCYFGKMVLPFAQVANWLNFLTTPHYDIEILQSESVESGIVIWFQASEWLYWYLGEVLHQDGGDRVASTIAAQSASTTWMPLAS